MAGITLAIAQARLDEYLAAESAALSNKSYTLNGRSFTRQDLKEIRDGVDIWNSRVQRLSRGATGVSLRVGVPR